MDAMYASLATALLGVISGGHVLVHHPNCSQSTILLCVASLQLLGEMVTEGSLRHVDGLSGDGPARFDPSLKLYPVAGFLKAHGLLQNQLLVQVRSRRLAQSGNKVTRVKARRVA
jgi:hypothetical protein